MPEEEKGSEFSTTVLTGPWGGAAGGKQPWAATAAESASPPLLWGLSLQGLVLTA